MHRRHTVVCSCVSPWGIGPSDFAYFVSGELKVLKVGQNDIFVSAHRRILGMASAVCVLVKVCVS